MAVVGGGPAGAAAARVLAAAGRRVLLLDAPAASRRKVGESLPGAVRPLLRRLGALDTVEGAGHRRGRGVWSAWGRSDLVVAHEPIASPHGAGWHLDRSRFDRDLRRLAEEAGATVRSGRVQHLERSGNGWRPAGDGGEVVVARFVIDATGRAATLARALGSVRRRDDDLVAVVAWVRATDDDDRTLVEATPNGWWYTARLPGDERALAFHTLPGEAAATLRRPERWAAQLAATRHLARLVPDPAGQILEISGAEACGASLDHSGGDGWLAVGDAALSFDPLSSQGLLTALYSGLLAGEAIAAALGGDPALLHAYPARLDEVRRAYLRNHRHAYRDETRWPDRPFWRGRAGRAGD